MKTCSFAIGCFLGICGIFPSIADTTVRYPPSFPSHLEKGKPFQLVFDKAVVPASEVGKPADPELMSFSPEEEPVELALGNSAGTAMPEGAKLMFVPPSLKFSSKWITPNVLECVPLEEVPFRSTYLWKPAENVRFLDGSPVPSVPLRLTGRMTWNFFLSSMDRGWQGSEVYPWESFFLVVPDAVPDRGNPANGLYRDGKGFLMLPGYCSWKEALEKNLRFAGVSDEEQLRSADFMKQLKAGAAGYDAGFRLRPATLKEVRDAKSYRVRNIAGEGRFRGRPDGMVVPGVYVIQPEGMFRYGRNYCLVSLDASFLSSRGGGQKTGWEEIKLGAVPRFSASGYYHAFSGNGGRFTLEWTLPVLIEDLERFCRDHVEFFVEGGGKPMAYGDQEGGFTTSLDGEDAETAGKIAIRLDRERLAEMKHARPLWYTSLPFLVSADEAVFKLQWRLKGVRSVDGQE